MKIIAGDIYRTESGKLVRIIGSFKFNKENDRVEYIGTWHDPLVKNKIPEVFIPYNEKGELDKTSVYYSEEDFDTIEGLNLVDVYED